MRKIIILILCCTLLFGCTTQPTPSVGSAETPNISASPAQDIRNDEEEPEPTLPTLPLAYEELPETDLEVIHVSGALNDAAGNYNYGTYWIEGGLQESLDHYKDKNVLFQVAIKVFSEDTKNLGYGDDFVSEVLKDEAKRLQEMGMRVFLYPRSNITNDFDPDLRGYFLIGELSADEINNFPCQEDHGYLLTWKQTRIP